MTHGPEAGLREVDRLAEDPALARGHRLHAVRAHLLERTGQVTAATREYAEAARRSTSIPEQRYLLARAGELP